MSVVLPVARPLVPASSRALLSRMTTARFALFTPLAMLVGLLASIATTTDPLWWHLHFSRLGTFHDASGALFNGTLIVSGALFTLLAARVRRDLRRLGRTAGRRGAGIVAQVLLSAIGINLALVGCIPLNVDKTAHDNVAGMMVLAFAGLLVTSPLLLHRLPRRLVITTAIVFVFLFCGAWLFVTATINLALFEVIAFSSIFVWTLTLTQCMESVAVRVTSRAEDAAPTALASPAVSATGAPLSGLAATSAHRVPRRRPVTARRASSRPGGSRPGVRHDAPAPLPRGCTASAGRAASAPSTTRARRSPRSPMAAR
jgi:hypothetical membrane protein